MSDKLRSVDVYQVPDNPFKAIADDWMLVTAGHQDAFNTMTASWGAMGELWHKKICVCFVRPNRHTYNFMEKADNFTLTFFEEGEWQMWFPSPNGLIRIKGEPAEADYFARTPEKDTDLSLDFLNFMTQRACWAETMRFVDGIRNDIHNCSLKRPRLERRK